MTFGSTLKKIRRSRGITQTQLAQTGISRSSIANYEASIQSPSFESAKKLIHGLGIGLDEFVEVEADYRSSAVKNVTDEFKHLVGTPDIDQLQQAIKHTEQILETENNLTIQEISFILHALIAISEGDLAQARAIVQPVWHRMQKLDLLFDTDILMLNGVFFVFELETAENIATFLENQIDKYHPSFQYLKAAIELNLSYLEMKHEHWAAAASHLESTIEMAELHHRFDYKMYAQARMHVINDDQTAIARQLNLLFELGESRLAESVRADVQEFLI